MGFSLQNLIIYSSNKNSIRYYLSRTLKILLIAKLKFFFSNLIKNFYAKKIIPGGSIRVTHQKIKNIISKSENILNEKKNINENF